MKRAAQKLNVFKLYQKLFRHYGPQHWWPVCYNKRQPEFEIACGAILTQSTSWKNVEKAMQCLYKNNLLSAKAVADCPLPKLQKCLRSSGYYKQKAKKLKIFSQWLVKNYQGNLKKFFKKSLGEGREELLSLWGVGPETADSILLYAGGKPVFVVDAYTKRLCAKFGIKFKTYDEYREWFEEKAICVIVRSRATKQSHGYWKGSPRRPFGTPRDDNYARSAAALYNELHALIVASGKDKHAHLA